MRGIFEVFWVSERQGHVESLIANITLNDGTQKVLISIRLIFDRVEATLQYLAQIELCWVRVLQTTLWCVCGCGASEETLRVMIKRARRVPGHRPPKLQKCSIFSKIVGVFQLSRGSEL